MSLTAKQIETDFFRVNSGLDSSVANLGAHMRAYFATQFSFDARDHLDVLYKQWLKKVIVDNGGTITSDYLNDLLVAAVAAVGGTVRNSMSDNKIELYQNV